MASKGLTMKGKKQTATAGVIGVILLLSKFFPNVYGMLQQQTGKIAGSDPQRSSEILNGIILIFDLNDVKFLQFLYIHNYRKIGSYSRNQVYTMFYKKLVLLSD